MIAIIDKVDSGKTRKLLNACSQVDGLFICAHPERVLDKCNVDKLINFLKDTYSKDQAFIYLSLISSKVEGFTLSCDGDQIMTLMYRILEN